MNTTLFMAQAGGPSPAKPDAPGKIVPVQPAPPAPLLWSPFRSELGARTDIVVIAVVVVVLGMALFGWALFFRRPSGRSLAGRGGILHEGGHGTSRRRRRSRHPSNAPRNPTLKERGGLPPERPSDEPGGSGPA
ncbi:MAG: hypothetical protein HY299_12635 [Verrucomicrobia bacterium]|nr:hypothetical protein [Verrucomicrobiota bacterium]